MALTAEGLVAGPRGRGLCLAVAERLGDVPPAHAYEYAEEVRDADATAAALVRAVAAVDLTPLAALAPPDGLVREVQESVDAAMYWQEPWQHDQLLARPELRGPLRRVAEAVVASPATHWWSSPVDLTSQHQVGERWDDDPHPLPDLRGVRERVRQATAQRREREHQALREHPLDVTASTRHDWWRVTGLDVAWAIPDWAAVAEEWDAVHLTVTGYLTTATRAQHVGDEVHTVLGGWGPDETCWLADVLQADGPVSVWVCGDDDVWRPRP